MVNKLPEKLLLLRKHFGFSQQEIADKMGVNVVEYMGWENGRSICNLAQFKRLSSIFQISLDDMLKNSADIPLPNLSLEDSIQIPFMKDSEAKDIEIPSMVNPQKPKVNMEATAQIKRVSEVEKKPQEQPKPQNTIHRVDINQKPTKKSKSNKKLFAIIGGVIGAIVLVAGIFWLLNMNKGNGGLSLKLSQANRLSTTEKFTVYIRDDQKVAIYGQGITMTDFTDLVKISAYKDSVVGLKSDGTLVAAGSNTNGQLDIKKIEKAVDVSLGAKHTAVALEDGKVTCVGDNSQGACNVDAWENIVDVEAGNGFTIGIDSTGNVKVAGSVTNSSSMESIKSVKSVSIGTNEVAFLNTSQTVTTVSYTGATATNVSTLKNITQVAVGNGFVAGLGSDGKVQIVTTNEDLKKSVEAWTGIGVISAYNNTLVGFTTTGKMVGAGDNQYNQYTNEAESTTKEKLEKVKNLQVSYDKSKVKLTWDKVEGADYYEVSIDTSPVYTAKAVDNTLTIDQSKLVDGQKYVITIIAASNTDKELNSEVYSVDFSYTAPTAEPTATPAFTLTIKYVYDDNVNANIYQDYVMTYNVGDTYRVESPKIDGYEALRTVVEGTMGSKNEEITVRYKAKPAPTPTPPTPTPEVTPVPPPTDPGTGGTGGDNNG
ncbi:helix-turn-helix domain-containing protein [Anaerorhabdus furcosa]|uniref:Transcriptional regulator, contains XRE-family HTH domain n=1 Tax=Anaerorhabdus furcosa TaxID=118967 RepID=A0A1T4KJ50_9FIRM|nr:helix-turn-helix domain-containing protein [Anaerorhabdus furcosa]SJZ42421.1 Transcriptional regulator, contains XRE-family HTH domain [Anaerorhabdus furcosa]